MQELENLNLSGPDRDKAEEIIAGVLGSIYSGQCPPRYLELVEINSQKAGTDTVSRSTSTPKLVDYASLTSPFRPPGS